MSLRVSEWILFMQGPHKENAGILRDETGLLSGAPPGVENPFSLRKLQLGLTLRQPAQKVLVAQCEMINMD